MDASLFIHQFPERIFMWAFNRMNDTSVKASNPDEMSNICVHSVSIVAFVLVLSRCCYGETGEFIGYNCSTEKSPNNSTYLTNRNKLFADLELKIVGDLRSVFSEIGERESNRILGFVQCHSLPEDGCSKCIIRVKDLILQTCGNAENAYMWLDDCFLLYGKRNISTSAVQNSGNLRCSDKYSGSQPQKFAAIVNMTISELKGSTNGKVLPVVPLLSRGNGSTARGYLKAQCYLQLSPADCSRCIENSKIYAQNSSASQNCSAFQIWSENCFFKYWVKNSYQPYVAHSPPRPGRDIDDNGEHHNTQHPLVAPSAFRTPPVPPLPSDNQQKSNRRVLWSIVGALFVSILLLFSVLLILVKNNLLSWRWRWRWTMPQNDPQREIRGIHIYSYELLRHATGNFDDSKKLGEGGYGSVYQGILPNGALVAVKRLSVNSKHGSDQFLNEANVISTVQHRNLVKLLGCCAERSEKLLVYEYLPNKSLDKILFSAELGPSLDWSRRKSIILGVARGLAYLHEESQPRIVHRDIKAGNILLDEHYNAKISDFGLARLFPEFGSHVSTRVAGTFGYLAPEYAVRGQLTEKADIFSFGVLFLEIISGRQNFDITVSPQKHFLLEWAWRLYELRDVWRVVDPKIDANYFREDIERSVEIAFLCVQGTAQLRPSMSQVVGMMTSEQPINVYPQKPALLDLLPSRDRNRGRDSGGSTESTTRNVATSSTGGAASSSVSSDISYLEPR